MAESWGRTTRRAGVALVTAGPGFTNSLTAIANASMANSPLVLLAGCVGIGNQERLDLQDMRQAPVIEPLVKKALVCQKAERIPEYIDLAFRTAESGRPGPVYLELPVDVLNTAVAEAPGPWPATRPLTRSADPVATEAIADRLGQAERPVIVAGSGAWYADSRDELNAFVEGCGAPVFTAELGRGLIPDEHHLCFESSLAIRPGAAMSALAGADLLILLGNRISLFYMFGELFSPETRLVQVDIHPGETGRNRPIDLAVHGDVRQTLAACNQVIAARGLEDSLPQRFAPWVQTLKQAEEEGKAQSRPDWESGAVPIHPLRLAREVDAFMNRPDDFVVADGGDTQIWMAMTRTFRQAGHYLDSGIFGCLGVGLPYANAAKLMFPDKRVCLLAGDGSIGFNFMEFETAVRRKLPVVTVISNDLGWGMIRHSQELKIGHAIETGTWIGRVEYQAMVEAMGGFGRLVERPEDIAPALEAAFASGKPACINVMTDPTTVSPGSVMLAGVGGSN